MDAKAGKDGRRRKPRETGPEWAMLIGGGGLVLGIWSNWALSTPSLARAGSTFRAFLQLSGSEAGPFVAAAVRNFKVAWGIQYVGALNLLLLGVALCFYAVRLTASLKRARLIGASFARGTAELRPRRRRLWWLLPFALTTPLATLALLYTFSQYPLNLYALVSAGDPELSTFAYFLDDVFAARLTAFMLGVPVLLSMIGAFWLLAFLEAEIAALKGLMKEREERSPREAALEAGNASS